MLTIWRRVVVFKVKDMKYDYDEENPYDIGSKSIDASCQKYTEIHCCLKVLEALGYGSAVLPKI